MRYISITKFGRVVCTLPATPDTLADIHTYQAIKTDLRDCRCLRGAIVATRTDDPSHLVVTGRSDPICATHFKPWPCRSTSDDAT